MKNKKLISAILAVASIAGGVVGAQAADLETVAGIVDKHEIKIVDLQTTVGIGTPLTNGAGDLSAGVNENTKAIKTKADAWETTKNFANVQEQLDTQDNKNKAQDVSIKAHAAAIKANKTAIATQGAQITQIQQDMAQDAIDRANEMDALTTKVNQKADKGDVVQNKNDIASNAAAIQTETQKRKDAVKGLQDQLTITNGQLENEKTNRENADTTLQGNIDNEIADRIAGDNALNSRINQVESDATKGIAKASALAALRPLEYDPDNKFDISAAGGFYKGENAFALGAFYRPNRNVMLSMGTTLTSGDNAYNVGLSFKIGKSGKHTETGLTTADLYAMIGAMQDKMDQQQKKIEELEAKQAK